MSKSKLISVRVDKEVLNKVEDMISSYPYIKIYSRSDVINGLLRVAVNAMTLEDILMCVRYNPEYYSIQPIDVSITRKERMI